MAIPNLLLRSGVDAAVTGTIASLALDATADVTFDLGPDWEAYTYIQVFIDSGISTSHVKGNALVFGQDSVSADDGRPLSNEGGMPCLGMYSMSRRSISSMFRPAGRYVRVNVTNPNTSATIGNGAFDASAKVVLCAYAS